MTNPIVHAVAENHFIPVMIVNNRSGYDSTILKKFGEPAWNYQVIRFIAEDEKDIIPRHGKVWTTLPLLKRMKLALEQQKKPVPRYLDLGIDELDTSYHRTVAISQYCYWTGEVKLGQIDGVIKTEAGWEDGHEVTKIVYNSRVLDIKSLLKQATELKCATGVYIRDENDLKIAKDAAILPAKALSNNYRVAKASDQKKQVNTLTFPKSVTMAQLTKFNAFFHGDREKAFSFLTEEQRKELLEKR